MNGTNSRTYSAQMDAARKRIIRLALQKSEGNKTTAAWALRMDRNYLQRLVKKYGLASYC